MGIKESGTSLGTSKFWRLASKRNIAIANSSKSNLPSFVRSEVILPVKNSGTDSYKILAICLNSILNLVKNLIASSSTVVTI
jgi:hypothetical protein